MRFDLDQYRQHWGLTYVQLAEKLGLTQRRHAMRWARGECWPDADKLQRIIEITRGEVTVEAMYNKRLAFLASRSKKVPANSVAFATQEARRRGNDRWRMTESLAKDIRKDSSPSDCQRSEFGPANPD